MLFIHMRHNDLKNFTHRHDNRYVNIITIIGTMLRGFIALHIFNEN